MEKDQPLDIIRALINREEIADGQWRGFFNRLLTTDCHPYQVSAALALLAGACRQPSALQQSIITACGLTMRALMKPVASNLKLLDIVGTGGDGHKTLNISTAAAIVAAATGTPVAKHGNRAMTSRCGAADVLTAAGVDLNLTGDPTTIEQYRIAFLFAPHHHPALARLAEIRKSLGFPTLFNLMGPLLNPASPAFALIGCFQPLASEAMLRSLFAINPEAQRAWIVHGAFGLDELFPAADNLIWSGDRADSLQFQMLTLGPQDCAAAGLNPNWTLDDIKGGSPEENANTLLALFDDPQTQPAYRDVVCLNTAAALRLVDPQLSLADAVAIARAAIDDGRARAKLAQLQKLSP